MMFSKVVFVALASEVAAWGCSGKNDPAAATCYEGTDGALGVKETVKLHLTEYSNGVGKMDLSGTGALGFTCGNHFFNKSGQEVELDLSDCLPKDVEVPDVKYCSDTDTISVTVKDKHVPIPIKATLKKVSCAESTELMFATCKGSGDLPSDACYTGKAGAMGATEDVMVEVKTSSAGGNGTLSLSGHGARDFSCKDHTFTKTGQEIHTNLTDCMTSKASIQDVQYCSESDQFKVVVKVVHIPFSFTALLSKVPCKPSIIVV